MEVYLQNLKKIDIKSFNCKKSIKKSKMNKETKLNIQLIIHDIILNGEISNDELLEPTIETINLIFELVQTVEKKKKISPEEELEIKHSINKHLKTSIKIIEPIYKKDEIQKLKDIITELKKIPQPEQRTPEWYIFRGNRLTASDLGTIMDVNPYEKYLNAVLKKSGVEIPFKTNRAIKHGVKYEEIVTMIYEFRNNVKVFEYGCIPHPEIPHFGASPDGIVDSNSQNQNLIGRMLEIKCPTGRPITGFCPEYYWAQVQGQLDTCKLELCDFVECNIEEYFSKEDFFNDSCINKNWIYNSSNMEKGVIVDGYDIKNKKEIFYYGPLGMDKKEIENWEQEIIDKIFSDNNLDYLGTSYWKLTKYNALLIKRDKEWWDKLAVPKINKYWDDVLEYRKKPMEELKKLHQPRKFKKVIKNESIDTFVKVDGKKNNGFLTDSDDD